MRPGPAHLKKKCFCEIFFNLVKPYHVQVTYQTLGGRPVAPVRTAPKV